MHEVPSRPDADEGQSADADLRSTRRRAWMMISAAVIVPAAVAGVIAWQLIGDSGETAPTITRVATTTAATTESESVVATTPTVTTAVSSSVSGTSAAETATTATTLTSTSSVAVATSAPAETAETATAAAAAEPTVDLSGLDPEARLAAWPEIASIQVQEGETLWLIAQNYDTTISAIATLNGIADPTALSVGQALRVPIGFADEIVATPEVSTEAAESTVAAATAASTTDVDVAAVAAPTAPDDLLNWHTIGSVVIEPGDNLAAIAAANNTNVEALMALNGIADGNTIYVGDVVLVPIGYQAVVDVVASASSSDDILEEETAAAVNTDPVEETAVPAGSEEDLMEE